MWWIYIRISDKAYYIIQNHTVEPTGMAKIQKKADNNKYL